MKFSIKIILLIFTVYLNSCSVEDPLPTSGENSFFAKLNGKRFVAEDIHIFPSGTKYGLTAYTHENSWLLNVKNTSTNSLYIYINQVTEPGNYLIEDPDMDFPNQIPVIAPTSAIIGNGSLDVLYLTKGLQPNEFIKITAVQGDSIIIGEFDKITLTDPENPNNKTILTDGKFNINTNTLNQPEP